MDSKFTTHFPAQFVAFNDLNERINKQILGILSGARRLVIVEAGSKRVEGIVSVSDVFRFLLGC